MVSDTNTTNLMMTVLKSVAKIPQIIHRVLEVEECQPKTW